jgi:hypothetical protein
MNEVLAASSPEAAEGVYCEFPDPTKKPNPTPEALKLRKLYEAKYGNWNETGCKWVSPWYGWLAAVKKADSFDYNAIKAVLPGLEISAPMGRFAMIKRPDIKVERTADSVRDWMAGQVRGGEVTFLKTIPNSVFIEYAEKKFGKKFQ